MSTINSALLLLASLLILQGSTGLLWGTDRFSARFIRPRDVTQNKTNKLIRSLDFYPQKNDFDYIDRNGDVMGQIQERLDTLLKVFIELLAFPTRILWDLAMKIEDQPYYPMEKKHNDYQEWDEYN